MDAEKIAWRMLSEAWIACASKFSDTTRSVRIGNSSPVRLNRRQCRDSKGVEYDSYVEYMEENKRSDFFPSYSSVDDKLVQVADTLNFLQMSKALGEDHRQTYVIEDDPADKDFPVEKHIPNSKGVIVNKSRQRADRFFLFWRDKAMALSQVMRREMAQGKQNSSVLFKTKSFSRYVLYGKPGVGKTAFLNYLFSVNAEDLLSRKVLWVRVSVSGNRLDPYDTLKARLYIKFIRIFCEFYLFERSFGFDNTFMDSLREFLLDKIRQSEDFADMEPEAKSRLVSNFLRLLRKARAKSRQREAVTVSFDDCHIEEDQGLLLTELLMSYIQSVHGYSYIFIFDGLDSVTIDYIQYNDFMKWLKEIDQVTDNRLSLYKALYIITMRDYSFISFFMKHLREPRTDLQRYVCCTIRPKPLEEILQRKYRLSHAHLVQAGCQCTEEQIQRINHNLMKLIYSELHEMANLEDPTDADRLSGSYFQHFMKLNNDNLRATMRFFRELIVMTYHVLGDESFKLLTSDQSEEGFLARFQGKRWILYRVLLHGGCTASLYKNRITYDKEGRSHISADSKAIIPNVFNYRDHITSDSHKRPKNLVKLRVIQYLVRAEESDTPATIVDCVKWLEEAFDYPNDDSELRYETREMMYNGLIVPNASDAEIRVAEGGKANYQIHVTELGKFILRKFISKAVYYETVVDDTPLQAEFCRGMAPLSRFDKEVKLGEYLKQKFNAIILFVLFLMELDLFDAKKYAHSLANQQETGAPFEFTIYDDVVVGSIKKDLASSLGKYLRDVLRDDGRERLEEYVKSWFQFWGKEYDREVVK